MDPALTSTVPEAIIFTGMDAFIHCIEALNGSYRNAIETIFTQSINLCRDVFTSEDIWVQTIGWN